MPQRPPRRRGESLQEVLTQAIADLTEHGFTSAERVAYWQARLAEAARRTMASQHQVDEMLRRSLAAQYERYVNQGAALKLHPGISRFTLEKLRPILRAELDRRIFASADLIKLNREQAVAKTLQRFSGWASSVPAGGSNTVNKREVKKSVGKAIGSLPFEERRVLIDQGHKLVASVNEVIARDGGALAVIWHSRWRQPGYDYRHDHKARDGEVYLLRDSWARKAGLVKPGAAGCYEDVTAVGEEPFCRCYAEYVYTLRRLPDDMITNKGRAELERVRKQLED